MLSIMSGETLQDDQRVLDPACGSGRMLLAAAKRNRFALLFGADLDITCCKMALINMLLNSLTGEIAHMNSLSNEFHTGYKVQTTIVNRYYIPYYVEFEEAELSEIWLRPLKGKECKAAFKAPYKPFTFDTHSNGVQSSLF
jgi:type I restriction-modification system DNA methylase subunit